MRPFLHLENTLPGTRGAPGANVCKEAPLAVFPKHVVSKQRQLFITHMQVHNHRPRHVFQRKGRPRGCIPGAGRGAGAPPVDGSTTLQGVRLKSCQKSQVARGCWTLHETQEAGSLHEASLTPLEASWPNANMVIKSLSSKFTGLPGQRDRHTFSLGCNQENTECKRLQLQKLLDGSVERPDLASSCGHSKSTARTEQRPSERDLNTGCTEHQDRRRGREVARKTQAQPWRATNWEEPKRGALFPEDQELKHRRR